MIARSIGRPHILPSEEIAITVERFKSYGYQSDAVAALVAAPRTSPSKKSAGKPKKL
ncbi:MAG: hypothetical protein WDN29_14900 [Methylovirgula sp.]